MSAKRIPKLIFRQQSLVAVLRSFLEPLRQNIEEVHHQGIIARLYFNNNLITMCITMVDKTNC
jgi:hypothetical protein